jgi:hypothetical protein
MRCIRSYHWTQCESYQLSSQNKYSISIEGQTINEAKIFSFVLSLVKTKNIHILIYVDVSCCSIALLGYMSFSSTLLANIVFCLIGPSAKYKNKKH